MCDANHFRVLSFVVLVLNSVNSFPVNISVDVPLIPANPLIIFCFPVVLLAEYALILTLVISIILEK
jgi:hypothetical protein